VQRRFLTVIAVVLGGFAALAVLLTIRGSLITGFMREMAESRLSTALGQPVAIGQLGFSLTPRPAFTGSDIRVGDTAQQAPSVRLDRVEVFPVLRSFLQGPIHVTEVSLDGFTVSILRDAGGRWRAPAVFPAPTRAGGGIGIDRVRVAGGRLLIFDVSANGALRERSRIDDMRTDLLVGPGGLRLAPLTGRVGGAAISGEAETDPQSVRLDFSAPAIRDADLPALFGLLAASRPAVLRVDEPAAASVSVRIDRATSRLRGSGTLRAPALTVEPLRLQQLNAPFGVEGTQLTFTPTTFRINGGSYEGRFTLMLGDAPAWAMDGRVHDLDMGALLDTIAGRDGKLDGRGRIDAELKGRFEPGFLTRMDGSARMVVSNGVLHDFPLLATVNRALRLSEGDGQDTRFDELSASLAIARGTATTDDLVIQAGHLRAVLSGQIRFDRSLNLRGRAIVSAERVAAGVASVHELARLRKASGEVEVPLTITGSLDAPKFDVDVGTVIREGVVDELRRRVRRLIK
jgi:AsmA-like C-terminal region